MISTYEGVEYDFPEESLAPQANIGTDPMEDKDIRVSQTMEVIK